VTDKNGKTLNTGDRIRFKTSLREDWLDGTVRHIRKQSYYNSFEQREDVWEAKVDDGDPNNIDSGSNGFTVSAWLEGANIELHSGEGR
jgi:hypothetical protein